MRVPAVVPPILPALGAAVILAACARPLAPPPPVTPQRPVVDTIHDVTFTDPYRWLEDQESPETREWIARQNAYADRVVGRPPLRARLTERLHELMDPADVGSPTRRGAFEFFTLRRPDDALAKIYRRPAADGPVDPAGDYELLVDPDSLSADGSVSVAIESVSPDGRLLVYSIRDGGRDEAEIRLLDVEDRTDLPDRLPPALYSSVAFDHAGTGFYYSRRSRQTGARVQFHTLGSDPADDRELFGDGYGPTAFVSVSEIADGKYLLFTAQHGWARTDVFFQDVAGGGPPTPLVVGESARFAPQFLEDRLYLLTNLDAPNNRILTVDLAEPAREHWHEVVPEGPDAIESFALIGGKLYVTYVHDASSRIAIFTLDGAPAGDVPVPPLHTATIRGAGPGAARLTLTSFAVPPVTYRLDFATMERTLWQRREVPFDSSGIEVRQVWYTSRDGTKAPMFLVHRRGLKLTGDHPTMLTGYGGFNASQTPRFDPRAAVWVEQGGVYALAVLRGGGEFGETWHRAGMLENKQHVFDDFIAAAEWLVANRYTSPARLVARGTSNGGLLVAAALTQRPDLFRAVLCGFPDLDMVRFHTFTATNNMPALLEYGNAGVADQFAFLREYSPYQHVREGVRYPAVMLTSGDLDTRVPPLQARRMTARLQAATSSGLPVILHYDRRAGHAGGRPQSHIVADAAMELTFAMQQTGLGGGH